ncbi:MAG TPA: hypothetical protein PKZ57_04625 [Methanoregulaceae archaeon]|nr:hypothetical protein [Methanoregulaceae archaeon]
MSVDKSGLLLESERKMPHTCRASFYTMEPGDELIAFLSHRPG